MNIEFKVVNHAANLNRTLSFDSDGHNILTKFMNCNNPLGLRLRDYSFHKLCSYIISL